MKIRETIGRFASNIQTWSRVKIAAVFGLLLAGTYVLAFIAPRHVVFSYAADTCVSRLALLPDTHKTTADSPFDIAYSGGFSIGSIHIVATKLCFTPKKAPTEGTTNVGIAPWGAVVFRANYLLDIGKAPSVLSAKTTAAIAITKPATYAIDKIDKVFTYNLSSNDKTSDCSVETTTIACNLEDLALTQGTEHTVTLTRSFKGHDPTKVLSNTLNILPAVTVSSSSPQANQVVFSKPTTLSFTTDKNLTHAEATLVQVESETKTPVETTTTVDKTTVTVTLAAELAREKTFVVTLISAEADDGSTINEPYVIPFTTSGGPKVSSVSIGNAGVDPNAKIVVTFDQPLAASVDIAKFARSSGAPSVVSKQGNQVIFALQNVGRCTAFTLTIDKGLTSESNGLASKDPWSYASRVNCRATAGIGYSVKGRPITAYYYGSGATTIMFTGGIHGSEPSGTTTMEAWVAHLDTYAYKIPAGRQVVVVPNTNPDSIAARSRYNANGVNIARNFATANWRKDIETTNGGILAGGGGSAPMSEPETQALATLTAQLKPRIEVSFHAQGRLVGANEFADSTSVGDLYASIVGYSTMYTNAEEVMGYALTGEYEGWMGEKLGLPAILIELPGASGNYFSSQQSALWRMVNL